MPQLRPDDRLPPDPRIEASSNINEGDMSGLLNAEPAPLVTENDNFSPASETDSETDSDLDSGMDPDSDSDAYSEAEPDETITATIVREIQDGTYTCLVCTSEIDLESKIWSCHECFRVYDLDCIKDWAKNGSSTDKVQKTWRCPACNVVTSTVPQKFTCWCGKVPNPRPNALMPFSCGNPCNTPYPGCVHSCSSPCHPGHHPVCGALGPLMKCHCGKHERQLPCLITPYETGWKCAVPCEVSVCDLGHGCPKKSCHSGFCGPCDRTVQVQCYCGQLKMDVVCYQRFAKQCSDFRGEETWIGSAKCGLKTKVYYDCSVHYDEIECQPLPTEAKKCKLSPDVVKTCHCGKSAVEPDTRTKCTDPIPECDSVCGKLLPCGCTCIQKCHSGECVCFNVLERDCSCGNSVFMVPCRFLQQGFQPKCTRKCPVLLNCRKHYHREVCCAFEKEALRREREKKKAIRNGTRTLRNEDETMTMEPIHICTRTCNRLKSCGRHYCEALCHAGPCGICLESSNEDLVCHCGKTRIDAPVRCGTVLECHEQCVRPKPCGHRPEVHECHDDNTNCPKCTVSVTKRCNCGRKEIKNVLCSQTNVSCGTLCTETKACGHPCLNVCSSDCTERNIHASPANCQLYCKKPRLRCPHMCKSKCHYKKPGKPLLCDGFLCKEPVQVQCPCGRKKKTGSCGGSTLSPSLILLSIDCDDDCLKAARDEELRKALLGDEEEQLELPYSDSLMDVYERQTLWCSRMEVNFRVFVNENKETEEKENKETEKMENGENEKTENGENVNEDNESGEKEKEDNESGEKGNTPETPAAVTFRRFTGLNSAQVAFLCNLASSFGLYFEHEDDSMFIAITKHTVVPETTIQQAVVSRQQYREEKNKAEMMKNKDIAESLFNAILVQDVFFGIVKDELERELMPLIEGFKIEQPKMHWMRESTYVFYSEAWYQQMTLEEENKLYLAMKSVRNAVRNKSLAFNAKLCLIDGEAEHILKINEKDLALRLDKKEEKQPSPSLENNSFSILEGSI